MIREFFCSGPRRRCAFAWGGLLVFVLYSLFKAWLKWALNGWYATFYDELQDVDPGSGDAGHFAAKRAAVRDELIRFAWIVTPAVVVHPVAKWIASVWRFAWRMALVRSYLVHYDVTVPPIEGAAQRIHEDTTRFESGIYSCVTMVLDSFLTLVIFVPVLLEVGAKAHPVGWDWPPWLLTIASSAAWSGLAVSMYVGRHLVWLEVQNQRVEAQFRTKLVLLEQVPAQVVGALPPGDDGDDGNNGRNGVVRVDGAQFRDVDLRSPRPRPRPVPPSSAFGLVLMHLWENYRRLFKNFAAFNTWISLYDQILVITPYLLVAPLMFAENPADRISLGTLMKVAAVTDMPCRSKLTDPCRAYRCRTRSTRSSARWPS